LPSLAAVLRTQEHRDQEEDKDPALQRPKGRRESDICVQLQVQLVLSANVEHVQRVRYKRCKRNPSRYRQISICVGKFLGHFFALRAQANFESNLEKS
jgi:hypothetical protein